MTPLRQPNDVIQYNSGHLQQRNILLKLPKENRYLVLNTRYNNNFRGITMSLMILIPSVSYNSANVFASDLPLSLGD